MKSILIFIALSGLTTGGLLIINVASILYNFNKLNKMNNMSDKIHFSFRQIHPKNIDHNFPIGIIQRKNILKSVRLHKIFILYILAVAICLAVFS